MCDSHKKLGVALELSADLPSPEVLDGWCGEPVKALVVSTSVFLTNKKGFPVLSRAHQAFVKRCFKVMLHTCSVIYSQLSLQLSRFTREIKATSTKMKNHSCIDNVTSHNVMSIQ